MCWRPGSTPPGRLGGAAGNVGAAVVELAAGAGVTVVGLARLSDAARCRALGARTVIDYRADDLAAQIAAAAPGGVARASQALRGRPGRTVAMITTRSRAWSG